MLKITSTQEDDKSFKVSLCGKLTKEYLPEVERTLASVDDASQSVALDLSNVTFVDREAMVFLCSAKSRKIAIENCPSYVIRWIKQENLCTAKPEDPQHSDSK